MVMNSTASESARCEVPEGWDLVHLGELLTFQNGVNADKHAYGTGVRFINVLEVLTKTHIHAADILGRVALPTHVVEAFTVRRGDIVFNRTSETQDELGLASVYDGDETVVFGGFVIRGRPRDGRLLPTYAAYGLRAPLIRQQIIARGQGAIRANIGQALLGDVAVALPTKVEQEAIAEALSDADAYIESLEQLIAKKRLIKQGAMQELLTGKRRLPGFEKKKGTKQTEVGVIPEDWDVVPFVKIVGQYIDYRGRTPKKLGLEWGGGDILALSANNVQMGHIDTEKEAYLGSSELYGKWMQQGDCQKGDVLLTMEAPLGNVAQIPDSKKYILSQRVLLIKPKASVLRDWLAHYMRADSFQAQLAMNATGSTAKGIQRQKLDLVPVSVPRVIDEQKAISSVLVDMHAELDALKAKLCKARQIKQGMMHNLLTGRIRLV
ncbi:MAG: restriction endonuclease subunit S [Deltaproteobacteria bacterium]|nr:restriction endonuclease subunit S [Deltaproteobacteria bacterium]